jgi:hypothetical protein
LTFGKNFMRVLQTLGRHGGTNQEGIFQYRRTARGIFVDGSVGRASSLNPASILLTHEEWRKILESIAEAPQGSFRLSGSDVPAPPNQVLYDFISSAVPSPIEGWKWTDSWRAYVAAILEHEGSVDLYAGPLGRGSAAFICLARDS